MLATDGLSEARNKHSEPFGIPRLTNLCAELDYNAPDLFLRSIFEARVRLKTSLKLRGVNNTRVPFDVAAVTESVTPNGFSCGLQVNLMEGAVVEVSPGDERPRIDRKGASDSRGRSLNAWARMRFPVPRKARELGPPVAEKTPP